MLLFWYCWSWDTHLQKLNLHHCHLLKCRDLHKSGRLSGSPFSHQSSMFSSPFSMVTFTVTLELCQHLHILIALIYMNVSQHCFCNNNVFWWKITISQIGGKDGKPSVCFFSFCFQQSLNTFHNRQVLSTVLPAPGNQILLVQFHGFFFV